MNRTNRSAIAWLRNGVLIVFVLAVALGLAPMLTAQAQPTEPLSVESSQAAPAQVGCFAGNGSGLQNIKGAIDGNSRTVAFGGVIKVNVGGKMRFAWCTDLLKEISVGDCWNTGNSADALITWFVVNYPPEPSLSKDEAAARQAALWYFTNNFVTTDPRIQARTQQIINSVPQDPNPDPNPPQITIDPTEATNILPEQKSHEFTVTLTRNGQPLANQTVKLSTNFGKLNKTSVTTDGNGQAKFKIKSSKAGTAQIKAVYEYAATGGSKKMTPQRSGGQPLVIGADTTTGKVSASATKIWQETPPSGVLRIRKVFDPGASGFTGVFTIHLDCSPVLVDDIKIGAGGSELISDLPPGTVCTVSEPTLPTPPPGWVFGTPTLDPPDGKVTIPETGVVTVIVTNTISKTGTGNLKVSKVFDPGNSGFTGSFTIHYDCGPGFVGNLTVPAGGSKTVSDIPTGTVCTVSEPTLPTPPPGWVFGTPVLNPPDGKVTIGANTTVEVIVTNTITPPGTGSLKISKSLDAAGSGFNGSFTVHYDCGPGFVGDVIVPPGGSETITGIPLGTVCTVSEPTLPTPPSGSGATVVNGVKFDTGDYSVCLYDPTTIKVTGKVSLPPSIPQARLQLSYYIVNPPDLKTNPTYTDYGLVQDGDTFAFDVLWPGIRPQDTIVEIHMGAALLDPQTLNPIPNKPNYSWATPVLNPPDGKVTINSASPAFVEVSVANSLVPPFKGTAGLDVYWTPFTPPGCSPPQP